MTRDRIIRFTKMHGAGNDYIYVNTMTQELPDPAACSIGWSARHTGIGSDGLVLIGRPSVPGADFSMRIFNPDGSEADMCGNASRCVGKYLYDKGLTGKTVIRLETLSGIKTLYLSIEDGRTDKVTVDMLEPVFENAKLCTGHGRTLTLTAEGTAHNGTFVSMGNPHFVIFTKDIYSVDVAACGKELEHNDIFPCRCNIEFAQKTAENTLRTKVWERGAGITKACGTGACATAVAAMQAGLTGRECRIVMDGGALDIKWDAGSNHVYMTGGAEFVFEGEIPM